MKLREALDVILDSVECGCEPLCQGTCAKGTLEEVIRTIEALFINMDWELLSDQKSYLLELTEYSTIDPYGLEQVAGLINLIDTIQDAAADRLKIEGVFRDPNAYAVCPNNERHTEFIASATIVQEWVIDSYGDYLEDADPCVEVLRRPSRNDTTWICRECGARAIMQRRSN